MKNGIRARLASRVDWLGLMVFAACTAAAPAAQDGPFTYEVIGNAIQITNYSDTEERDLVIPSEIAGLPVTSIGDSAFKLSNLQFVEIPDGVTSIGRSAFHACYGLLGVHFPAALTVVGDSAFENCHHLKFLHLPSGVTDIGAIAFRNCFGLSVVTLPQSLTSLGARVFTSCRNVVKVDLPDGLTQIGPCAFEGCRKLSEIEIPASVSSIGNGAFYDCPLTAITFLGDQPILGDVFRGTHPNFTVYFVPGSASFTVPTWLGFPSAEIRPQEGLFTYEVIGDTVEITDFPVDLGGHVTVPAVIDNKPVTSIGESAFRVCTFITRVDLPDSVTSIGASAFQGCTRLIGIGLPSGITALEDLTFDGCTALVSISIPTGVESIGFRTFYNCRKMISVTVPASVTSIGDEAFHDCDGLYGVKLQHGLDSIASRAFSSCGRLTEIEIPASVTSIGNDVFKWTPVRLITFLGDQPALNPDLLGLSSTDPDLTVYFEPGSAGFPGPAWSQFQLAEIRPQHGVFSYVVVGEEVQIGNLPGDFIGEVEIPSEIDGRPVTSIGNSAFKSCGLLEDVVFPDSVTSFGHSAFQHCGNLTSITFPPNLTSLGSNAYDGCSKLTSLEFPPGLTSIGAETFARCPRADQRGAPAGGDEPWLWVFLGLQRPHERRYPVALEHPCVRIQGLH